jgi:acetylornithine/succinyldiaminopimelate/putrescine aminotransferase
MLKRVPNEENTERTNPKMDAWSILTELRSGTGAFQTEGLSDEVIQEFLKTSPDLKQAIVDARDALTSLDQKSLELRSGPEEKMITDLQQGVLNFYPATQTNPYVPLSAKGPWIVTMHGRVIHDSGGYGMLGFGHSPDFALAAMGGKQIMANVMTSSPSQLKVINTLRCELSYGRKDEPYYQFIFMNSGSESVTVGTRISDHSALNHVGPGGKYEGREVRFLNLKGSFHGRTDRPAKASDSCRKKYEPLASSHEKEYTYSVEPNNLDELKKAFEWADSNNVFFEMMLMEPVMGEGNPGQAISRDFYDLARKLTLDHGSLLLMDSIQAGLRTQGCLSICSYPGFEDCVPPDMETFSKAVNAGQFPLSILALNERAAKLYKRGFYGNTMTANPRSLDVAVSVLEQVTPELRENIRERGKEFIAEFKKLQAEFPDIILGVQGTGLLCAIELNPKKFMVTGENNIEDYLRRKGMGVIHGGQNALRFTPHFRITSEEVKLVASMIKEAFLAA